MAKFKVQFAEPTEHFTYLEVEAASAEEATDKVETLGAINFPEKGCRSEYDQSIFCVESRESLDRDDGEVIDVEAIVEEEKVS
jgi:hypothetical protein